MNKLYRILAIDYGETRIGLALSDPLHIIAKPFKNIINNGKEQILQELKDIIKENMIGKIVLGLPYNLKGEFSHKTNEVKEFYSYIKEYINIPIILIDERFTTVDAEEELKKMKKSIKESRDLVDAIAASFILRRYLKNNNE